MNVINDIMNKLNDVFKEVDEKVLNYNKSWAITRQESMYEFMNSEEAKGMKYIDKYYKAVEIASGKTWYTIFYGNSKEYVLKFVEKNCKAIVDRRNNSITKKLIKANVSKVISSNFVKTSDGFNGVFEVETDKGNKKVIIETIYAGGYNIQCLHSRVLVKIK